MASLNLTDDNKVNLDVPVVSPIVNPSLLDREMAGYASLLTSQDPLNNYRQIMSEIEFTGTSRNLDSALSRLKVEENKQLQKTVADIINDKTVTDDEKRQALQYYSTNRDVLPSLKERFSLQAATANPNANDDLAAVVEQYQERNKTLVGIQTEINKTGANLSEDALGAFGGLFLEISPLLGAGYKGYQLSEIKKAVDGKDYGVLRSIWNGVMQGTTEQDIRQAISNIPTTEGKARAISRILDVIKELPGTDYNKYTALRSSVEGDLANWEKNLYDVLGLFGLGAGLVVGAKTLAKLAPVRVTPTVNPDSILGRSSAHNPELASRLAGQALVDESGEIAAAIGARQPQIVSSMLSKVESEVGHALNVEAAASTRALLKGQDEAGIAALALTERNMLLYPKELMDDLSSTIKDVVVNSKAASVHLGKSSFNAGETGVSGTAVFGKTDVAPFNSYQEALDAAKVLAPDLPEGAVTVVKPGRGGKLRPAYSTTTTKGDHYLQYNYAKEVTAQDIVLYGPDAVRIKFDMFGRELKFMSDLLTRVALSGGKVGNYLFAHHAMPAKAAAAAFSSFDKALAVEEPFLTYARRFVAQQSAEDRTIVAQLLKEGEEFSEAGQLGKVFDYDEVIKKGLAKGLSQSQAEEVAKGYYVYRRTADWMYTLADRSKSKALRNDGYKWITPAEGSRVAGKAVTKGEIESSFGFGVRAGPKGSAVSETDGAVRSIVNHRTGDITTISRKEIDELYDSGESLIRLAYPIKQGDTVIRYAKVGRGFGEEEIMQGALPYIRGYVPRGYDNNYFVVRTPKQIEIDGVKSTDIETLEKNRSTHAASDSLAEAKALAAKLQEADPTGNYTWKRERLNEKSILDHGDVFRQNMIHSSRRGPEALEGGNQIDPLVGLISLIQSMSKKASMEDFLDITKRDFVRNYGDFLATKGAFPTGADKIIAKANMTGDEAKRLHEARSIYNWMEGMMLMQRYDSEVWKNSMYAAGEFAEKFAPIFGTMLRSLGKHYPMDYLRKISTAFFISLRPDRQILLQPSQLMLYPSIDPKLLNPLEAMKFVGKIGALGMTKFYKNGSKMAEMVPDELIIKAGAKMFRQTDEEFKATLESFKNSGLIQSIDSNLLVDGLYSQKHKKLVESFSEKIGRNVEASIGVLPRLGRQIGFDRGEEINLAGSWIIARDRFAKMHPDVDINSGYARESVASVARELAFSMTRPGAFQYQKNALSVPLQFIAAPHKALLSFTTSKTLTSQEKARLMAAHFILYGSAGLGIQQFVMGDGKGGIPGLDLRGKFGADAPEELFTALEGGLADWGGNKLASMLLNAEGEEESRIDFSYAFSPLSGGTIPFGQFLEALSEKPFYQTILGPSWNIVNPANGRIITAIRDIASMMQGDEDTKANFRDIAYRAAEISSGGTDWMKYRMARDFDLIVAANGYIVDDRVTSAETMVKLFGIGTTRERVFYDQLKKFRDEDKEIEAAVKYLYDGFWKKTPIYGDSPEEFAAYNRNINAYMSTIQDPALKRKMQDSFRRYSTQQLKTTGRSVTERLYNSARDKTSEQLTRRFNELESYGMKEQADVIRNLMGVEQ